MTITIRKSSPHFNTDNNHHNQVVAGATHDSSHPTLISPLQVSSSCLFHARLVPASAIRAVLFTPYPITPLVPASPTLAKAPTWVATTAAFSRSFWSRCLSFSSSASWLFTGALHRPLLLLLVLIPPLLAVEEDLALSLCHRLDPRGSTFTLR
jgi:hypothetical protein